MYGKNISVFIYSLNAESMTQNDYKASHWELKIFLKIISLFGRV